ncbi:MAG: SRPBCC family protein [Deltaproteobacteria bacterium]|nr:SRPBCC family protein [Deltaproteobacteria bacterium]
MAKFPTTVEESVTVGAPMENVYAFLWDVVGSSRCIPGIDHCRSVGADTFEFLYKPRSTGPITMVVRYTARYQGNGRDNIRFVGVSAAEDNTDVEGTLALKPKGPGTTVTLTQTLAPDTPVPRLLQSLIRSFVEAETAQAMRDYLLNVRSTIEKA